MTEMKASGAKKACRCGCGKLAKAGRNYREGHKPKTPVARILARLKMTEAGCWEYTGAKTPHGYGHVYAGGGKYRSTHRLVYEATNGPVTEGLHLDHLCRNRACCNPDHLEAVTPTENAMRGEAPMILLHNTGACARGHDADTHALRRRGNGRVVYCRQCRREDREVLGQRYIRPCCICSSPVIAGRSDAKYCSPKCRNGRRWVAA